MKLCKLLLAAVGATVLMSAFVSTASARTLSSSGQELTSTFRTVRFRLPFGETVCEVTLSGSLHNRTIAKNTATLQGFINAATLGPCSSGAATILTETLPWHAKYRSFSGTLPNITRIAINVIGSSFRVREPRGITCLARSTEGEPAIGTFEVGAGGRLSNAEISGAIRTGGECLNQVGNFSSDRGGVTALTITLI